jgi:hypothetical protein
VRAGHPLDVEIQAMSKFREASPQAVAPQAPAPQAFALSADDLSLKIREAKLAAMSRDAFAEAKSRLKYQILQRVLAAIETLEAAPDDPRSKLQAVSNASRLFIDDEDIDPEGDEGDDDL